MMPFMRTFKGFVPIVSVICAGLVLPQAAILESAFAEPLQIAVFGDSPLEALMSGRKPVQEDTAADLQVEVWSKPAQSSQQPPQAESVPPVAPAQPVPKTPPPPPEPETPVPQTSAKPELEKPEAKDIEKAERPQAPQDVPAREEQQAPQAASGDSCPADKPQGGPNPADLLKQASDLETRGDYAAALLLLERAFERASSASDQKLAAAALHAHARVLYGMNRQTEALAYVNQSIELNKALKNARGRSIDLILAGRIQMALSDHPAALKSLEEAQKILPEAEASMRPELMEDMAACLLRLDKYSDALASLNRGLSYCLKQGNQAEAGKIHLLMGEINLSRSDVTAARANFKKAWKLFGDAERKRDVGETLLRIAYVDRLQGDFKASRSAMQEGMELIGSGPDAGTATTLSLVVRGMAEADEGKTVQAGANLSSALSRYEKAGDSVMAARVRLALARLARDRARFESALDLGGRALNDFRTLSSPAGEAASLHVIAEVYFLQGFVHKALEYGGASLSIAEKINDRNQIARSAVALAEMSSSTGDMEQASKMLKTAVAIVKAGVNRRTSAEVRLALARFRFSRDAFDRALQDASEARKEYEEIDDRRGKADCDHLTGLIYELRGERDKALGLLQQALQEHQALSDRFGEGKDLTAIGVHYKNLGDQEKALEYFGKALDLRKGIGDRRGYAANLANIGNLKRNRNLLDEAIQNLDQALALYRELSDKKGEADVLTGLGNAEAARGAQAAALEKLSAALALHREIQDPRGIAANLTSMGRLYLTKGDVQNASTSLEEAAKVSQRINDPRGELAISTELAMVNRAKGNSAQALTLLKNALEQARKLNDARAMSSIRLKTATVLEDTGQHDQALALLQKTLVDLRRQDDRHGELWALSGIAVIQVKTEDYEKALANLHKALKLLADLGLPASQSTDLHFYLGEIYEGFRDFERALDHYHKALTAAQVHGTDNALARIYDRLGTIYYLTEDYPKAKDFLEDALRLNSELRDAARQKTELVRLGDVLSKLGDHEAALKYQQRALTVTRGTGDERTEARILTRIGTLNQMLGKPRVALQNYEEARDIRTKIGDRRGVNENLLQIALVNSILGGFNAAIADLKSAFEISQKSEDRGMLWKAYFIMGRALEERNSIGEALESYRKAITILEAMEADIIEESDEDNFIFGGRNALFETTLRVLMKLARKDPQGAYDSQALRIVEKLKAAEFENTLSRINVDSFSDLPQELLIKEKSLKLSLRKLNSRLAEELSKVNPDQAHIKKLLDERRAKEEQFTKLKDRLVKEYPSYADLRYPRPISVHQLQKSIVRPDEALLVYMVTRGATYLFAIDKQRFHVHSINYASKDMRRDIDALMKPLHRADTQSSWDPSIAYRIYSKIISPVEYFLAAKKAVVVVPHGPLTSLPFEILVSSQSHAEKRFWSASDKPTYLVEKYAFAYAPSASVLAHLRTRKHEKQPGWSMVAFGDAVYSDPSKGKEHNPGAEKLLAALGGSERGSRGPDLRSLPGTKREISEIVKIVGGPTQVYLGDQATETLFKKADLSRYGYVHLATHGVVLTGSGKGQQQPAIVFSLFGDKENDGFLQLGEVFGLKLNADLVVLSSCLSSGKPYSKDASGFMALSRGFLFAGSDSVVLSMWQVNDESTAKLFIEMYRNLKDGSKAEALRQAQLSLIGDSTTCHPYYWAPFVLVGEWTVGLAPGFNKVDSKSMRFNGISTWRKLLSM
jgi:CHAT domain-containing protein/outer membrane biosynthesis protein TonB/Tfp pilus assembly protein PilF